MIAYVLVKNTNRSLLPNQIEEEYILIKKSYTLHDFPIAHMNWQIVPFQVIPVVLEITTEL
jgi:hypothetical protein